MRLLQFIPVPNIRQLELGSRGSQNLEVELALPNLHWLSRITGIQREIRKYHETVMTGSPEANEEINIWSTLGVQKYFCGRSRKGMKFRKFVVVIAVNMTHHYFDDTPNSSGAHSRKQTIC
jgi:hypothetical protein